MGIAINGTKVGGIAINGRVVGGMAYNGKIIYRGTPVEWQRLSETDATSPGGNKIRPYGWDNGNREMTFYTETDFNNHAVPGEPDTFSVLFTLHVGNDNILKLCAGNFNWDGLILAWVPFVGERPVGGAQASEAQYTISQFSEYGMTGYRVSLSSSIPIIQFFGEGNTVLYADDGSASTYSLEIQKV